MPAAAVVSPVNLYGCKLHLNCSKSCLTLVLLPLFFSKAHPLFSPRYAIMEDIQGLVSAKHVVGGKAVGKSDRKCPPPNRVVLYQQVIKHIFCMMLS